MGTRVSLAPGQGPCTHLPSATSMGTRVGDTKTRAMVRALDQRALLVEKLFRSPVERPARVRAVVGVGVQTFRCVSIAGPAQHEHLEAFVAAVESKDARPTRLDVAHAAQPRARRGGAGVVAIVRR